MTKVNQNDGNETKSDIFPWNILRSDAIFFFIKKILKHFNDSQNLKFLIFMTKVNPSNGIKTKLDIFSVRHIQI